MNFSFQVIFRSKRVQVSPNINSLQIKGSKEPTHGSACRKSRSILKWDKKTRKFAVAQTDFIFF